MLQIRISRHIKDMNSGPAFLDNTQNIDNILHFMTAADIYQSDQFYTEPNRLKTSTMVGGWQAGDTFQLKYTLPALTNEECVNKFDVQTAMVLYQTGTHEDLARVVTPSANIVGVGTPRDPAKRKRTDVFEQGADILGEQIGIGAVSKVSMMVYDAAKGVANSARSGINLDVDDEHLGNVNMQTKILLGVKHLERNGFPSDLFSTYFRTRQHTRPSGVILIKLEVHCTRQQIQAIMAKIKSEIDPRYGVARLVVRVNLPESEFDNIGNRPWITLHTAARHMTWRNGSERRRALKQTDYAAQTEDMHLDRVRYLKGLDFKEMYRKTVDKNTESLMRTFQENPELQMQHLASRLYQVYTRSVRRVQAVCRKRGYQEEMTEITDRFLAAFNQFRIEKEKEASIGSVYIPVPLSPADMPCMGRRTRAFMQHATGGNEILHQMLVELEASCVSCRKPQDYILALSEKADLALKGASHPLLKTTDVRSAYDPDLLMEIADKKITSMREIQKGELGKERKRIKERERKEKKK